ncbi:hypothetical protein [Vibrio quintilis]|uniref:Core-binding (CB) domain-containing protein n=1 Tax=Vibrio quintilis TaxID=1117707 RepID=A0A1M7YNZ7_9VIBR|nr:hypothetical protein [Vibrio quintilis]SHO54364.1 hypothetical protein VQ7734_00078 [Vibrio quintilis]
MAGRRRSTSTSHYPAFLIKEKVRGKIRFRFTLTNGERRLFPIGTTESDAIQTALAYNLKHRKSAFSLECGYDTTKTARRRDKFDKPFKVWADVVWERILNEEALADHTLVLLRSTLDRMIEEFGHIYSKDLTLEHINSLFERYYKSVAVTTYNNRLSQIRKIFSYLADESAIERNFSVNKRHKKDIKGKTRADLSLDQFKKIYALAPLRLKVAMMLTLQTTHSTSEVTTIRYRIKSPQSGVNGIVWFNKPQIIDGETVYGTLYIHRKKVQKTKASHVAFPVTDNINDIIKLSRQDRINCPYVVHAERPDPRKKAEKGINHPLQLKPNSISHLFAYIRDKLPEFNNIPIKERPTYHEIRRLSARLYDEMGMSPTVRMAHNSSKTTMIYTDDKSQVKWNEVPAKYIQI